MFVTKKISLCETSQIILEVQTMKKFFELSVTSRKVAQGDLVISAEALSSANEKLGQLDIKLLKDENTASIFFKYTPVEDCNPDTRIARIKLTGRDEDEIREALEMLVKAYHDSAKQNPDNAVAFFMISLCIQPATNSIVIPDSLVPIPCGLISSILGDDWFGIETKISPELLSLADAKIQMEEDELKAMFEAAFKNITSD